MLFLNAIVEAKRQEIAVLKAKGMSFLLDQWQEMQAHVLRRSFYDALVLPTGLSLIAEVKKASPSKGIIREQFNPVDIALGFNQQGAAAISVLTEKTFFLGDPNHLTQVRAHVDVPVLRKDFILDRIQIAEAAVLGADAVLLIKAILPIDDLINLHMFATELGLDVLVEVHDEPELNAVLAVPHLRLIGINNRNLDTFEVDITLAERLATTIQKNHPTIGTVAESGYQTAAELARLDNQGISAVLIGEGLAKNAELMGCFRAGLK